MRPYTEVLWEWFLQHAEASEAWFKRDVSDKVMQHLRECGVTGDRPRFLEHRHGDTKLTSATWECKCGEYHTASTFWDKNRVYAIGPLIVDDDGLTEAELAYTLVRYEQARAEDSGDPIERLGRMYGS